MRSSLLFTAASRSKGEQPSKLELVNPPMQVKTFASLILLAGLAGCASLPTSGPTRKQIEKSAAAEATLPIKLVHVVTAADIPGIEPSASATRFLPELAPPPTDMIGPGDVLNINIYEAGVTLFAGPGSGGAGGQGGAITADPGVRAQRLPPNRVNDDGDIFIPYGGKLHVVGLTLGEVEALIRRSLRRVSENPQVVVTLEQAITNSVIMSGEVAKPGRLVLQTNRETLSDVVALAGGYRGNARDLSLRVVRRNEKFDIRMDELVSNLSLDVRAYPGDRLMLINAPRSFAVLGAGSRIEQLPFTRSSITLAEAMSNAGGVNPNQGDPAAVFVFRYVTDAQGNEEPVVYHFNMMKAGSYFLVQRFEMQDRDVLYFGNAAANQPGKLFQLISQLFTPLMTVTAAVQTVNNSNN